MAVTQWSSGNAQKFPTSFQSHKRLWRAVWREVSRWKKSSRFATHMSHAQVVSVQHTTSNVKENGFSTTQCLAFQEGNIFIADYELLDGVTANATDPCTLQYLAAPICLLYKNIQNKIMPIAIQVSTLKNKHICWKHTRQLCFSYADTQCVISFQLLHFFFHTLKLPFEIRQTVQLVDAFVKRGLKQDEYKQFNIKETNVLLKTAIKSSLYLTFSLRE